MKIEIMQDELARGLGFVSRAVASRPQLAVLSNILLDARPDGLFLSATDLELGMGIKIQAKVLEVGLVTVPAKTLYEFVGSLNPGKVNISLDKETLVVSSGSYKAKFQTISAEEFPTLPEITGESRATTLAFSDFAKASQLVLFAAARDSLRPVLTGILMEIRKSSLSVVATDGFRLAIRKVAAKGGVDELSTLLVPMRAVSEVARTSGEGDLVITHVAKANQVIFSMGDVRIVTQMIEGSYPDYNKIVPKDFLSEFSVSRDELLQAVKASYIFARDNSNMMKWEVSQNELVVTAETPERGDASVSVPIALEGEGGRVVFNAKFVLDFLGASGVETIRFGMGEPLAPCAFREQGNEDFLYVVMPINA